MTDHRVTDLAIGRPGRPSYDPEQGWKFSQTLTDGFLVKQLLAFEECIRPSGQIPSRGDEKAPLVILNQRNWLSKTLPETVPARTVASSLLRKSWGASPHVSNNSSSLLAIGRAHDPERLSGTRRPQIIAVPCGAAGHVLQLLKPRIETRGWGRSSGARLSFLNLDSPDSGYWMGTGGTIRQIVAADGENDKERWLAVRQATVVTLFLPTYGRIHANSVVSTGSSTFAPSLLNANPVVSLTAQRSGSKTFSDITFNPWFPRQFAVVDTLGYWSIWEVDARHSHSKNSSEVLVAKETGGIYEGQAKDGSSEAPELEYYDGWCRIFWASNLSTVVVCNRRHITVFDIKAQTTPFGQVNIFPIGNADWILDIQRSTSDFNDLYVLTSSRIYWIEIIPSEKRTGHHLKAGGRVILSYFHFMSADDATLKLTPLKSDRISVAITSAKIPVVNYYAFRKPQPRAHVSSQGTFSLFVEKNQERTKPLHTVNFLPCHLVPSVKNSSGLGPEYVEDGVEFFQLWVVTDELGLLSSLLAVAHAGKKELDIKAPDTKLLLSSQNLGPRFVHQDKDFVVPDDQGHSKISQRRKAPYLGIIVAPLPEKDDLRFRMDWRTIYRRLFLDEPSNEDQPNANLESDLVPGFPELLSLATDHVMQRKEQDARAWNITLADIIGTTGQGEDLNQASPALQTFLESLEQAQSSENRWKLSVKNLTLGTGFKFLGNGSSLHPELLEIFDQLVDFWMASLTLDLPNIARYAKFKVIRQLAKDLCLNSIGISLQDRALHKTEESAPIDDQTAAASMVSKDGRLTKESSPLIFSSQLVPTENEPGLSLPTPTQTSSSYSQATSASGLIEDSAIARLRQYAPTIKAKTELRAKSNGVLLSHWPSALADPAEYSHEAAKNAWAEANNDDKDARSSRKEKARRRIRTEEFVKAVEPAVSRRLALTSGSQPEAIGKMFSSQPVNEMPMTQPDRGTFGSRTLQQAKKKSKKQRTAGFK